MLGEQTVHFPCRSQQSSFSLYNQRDIHMHTIYFKPWQTKQSKCTADERMQPVFSRKCEQRQAPVNTRARTSPLIVVGRLNDDIIRTRTTVDCHGRLPWWKKKKIKNHFSTSWEPGLNFDLLWILQMQSNIMSRLNTLHFLKAELQCTSYIWGCFILPFCRSIYTFKGLHVGLLILKGCKDECINIASLTTGVCFVFQLDERNVLCQKSCLLQLQLVRSLCAYLKPQTNCKASVSSLPQVY